ncbi:MAG: hypothetical protein HY899_02805 [Deltaproteobacteria bacterium]|nr:hypothetical protein [Deltaproteobacteria bacterium]
MSMTAAEALRSAEPPVDDGGIDQALADLDIKIWTWTDAMLSARAAIKRSLAHKEIFSRGGEYSIGSGPAAGVAAQPMAQPPASAQGFTPFGQPGAASGAGVAPTPSFEAHESAAAFGASWGSTQADGAPLQIQQPAGPAVVSPYAAPSTSGEWAPGGAMPWPSADSSTASNPAGEVIPVAWPSVTPEGSWKSTETQSPAAAAPPVHQSATAAKSAERAKKPAPPRISPEETAARAARAAREEALLASLDETSARRVRLLRRLDPDADIEQLVEKASQSQPREGDKSDKTDKTASWWRRK